MSSHIIKYLSSREGANTVSFDIKKIYTENPYVDEMVYYTKLLAAGTVLKMQEVADNSETLESLKSSGVYMACVEGHATFDMFTTVSRAALNSVGIIDEISVQTMMRNKENVPISKRDALTRYMITEYIDNYEELNPYYRALNGLPAIGKEDYVEDWMPPANVSIDLSKPIHMMSKAEAIILENHGVLEDLIKEDPANRQYMRHLGNKKIDYYTARKANRFDPIFIPSVDSDAIYKMYRDKLDENKIYVLRTVYSEAFKYNSDYYDNFIAVLIVIITMVDIISRVQEFVARKEIFDIRSVQYIFESNGVPFFEEIPLKYQISMVKNLHTLLKFKSTSRCMVDICSLFGFDNIQIFKYYMLKDRNIDLATGEYVVSTDENGNEILEDEYTLKFLKLPLEGDVEDYIRNGGSYLDYDEITLSDPTWDGGLNHDEVMKSILEEEFNLTRTKYISIDSITDIAKASAQQSYFLNLLYDNVDLEGMITLKIPYIEAGREFDLVDVFTLLTVLTYNYNGVKDTIMDTQSKVLYVNGFNFKVDLAVLAEEIARARSKPCPNHEEGYFAIPGTIEHAEEQLNRFEDEIDDYVETTRVYDSEDKSEYHDETTIKASIPSFKALMNLYINNMEIRDELIKGMQQADNKKVYDTYKKLYDALMTVKLNMDFYKNPETGDFYRDEQGDATYSAYLAAKDPSLYAVVLETENFVDETSRNQYIATVIDSIIYALEEYLDTKEFSALFSNLPIMSIDAVKGYIATVINFYKSYKVHFLGINTIYTFADKSDEGSIRIIDDLFMNRFFQRSEFIKLYEEFSKSFATMSYTERVNLIERIYFDISTWVYRYYDDEVNVRDRIGSMLVSFITNTYLYLADKIDGLNLTNRYYSTIRLMDIASVNTTLVPADSVWIADRLWIYEEGEASIYADYMDKVADHDVGRIIVADKKGNASPAAYILNTPTLTNSDSVITEAGAEMITQAIATTPNDIVRTYAEMEEHAAEGTTSDTAMTSEAAILEALSFKYYKAT